MKFYLVILVGLILPQVSFAAPHDFTSCQPAMGAYGGYYFNDQGKVIIDKKNKGITSYDTEASPASVTYAKQMSFYTQATMEETAYVRKNDNDLPTSLTIVSKDDSMPQNVRETQFDYDSLGNCFVNRTIAYNSKDPKNVLVTYDKAMCDRVEKVRRMYMKDGLDLAKCENYQGEISSIVKRYNSGDFSSLKVSDAGKNTDKDVSAKVAGDFIDTSQKYVQQEKPIDTKNSEQLTFLGAQCAIAKGGYSVPPGGMGMMTGIGGYGMPMTNLPMGGGYYPDYKGTKPVSNPADLIIR